MTDRATAHIVVETCEKGKGRSLSAAVNLVASEVGVFGGRRRPAAEPGRVKLTVVAIKAGERRRGSPTDAERDRILAMRASGKSNSVIAAETGRTRGSIAGLIHRAKGPREAPAKVDGLCKAEKSRPDRGLDYEVRGFRAPRKAGAAPEMEGQGNRGGAAPETLASLERPGGAMETWTGIASHAGPGESPGAISQLERRVPPVAPDQAGASADLPVVASGAEAPHPSELGAIEPEDSGRRAKAPETGFRFSPAAETKGAEDREPAAVTSGGGTEAPTPIPSEAPTPIAADARPSPSPAFARIAQASRAFEAAHQAVARAPRDPVVKGPAPAADAPVAAIDGAPKRRRPPVTRPVRAPAHDGAEVAAPVVVAPPPSVLAPALECDNGVDIWGLKAHHCRWPLGDPHSEDFRYCGKTQAPGYGLYCSTHKAKAYTPRGLRQLANIAPDNREGAHHG